MRGEQLADTYHQDHIQVMTDGGSVDNRDVDTIDRELELLAAVTAVHPQTRRHTKYDAYQPTPRRADRYIQSNKVDM